MDVQYWRNEQFKDLERTTSHYCLLSINCLIIVINLFTKCRGIYIIYSRPDEGSDS